MNALERVYNSELLKGTGLIQETLLLLDVYESGISKSDLVKNVLDLNVLGKEHKSRTKDIINYASQRRFLDDGEDTILELKQLRNKYLSLETTSQILYIYTCRANLLLFDFIVEVYQVCVSKNELALPEKATLNFIEAAIRDGRIVKRWAESTKRKVSQNMNACLIDFKLIDRNKNILPFFIDDLTANYWLHKLRFKGLGDEAILASDEWKLFGLGYQELIALVQRLSFSGHFLFQHSGELAKIGWKYQSMNDFLNGTA